MQFDEPTLRKYLLGNASEVEENEIGVRMITDEDFVAFLEHVENELLEDHLDGVLTPIEQNFFNENFLVSERRRSLLREVRSLRAEARDPVPQLPPNVTVFKKRPAFLSLFARPLLAGAAAMAILAGFFVCFIYFREARSPLEIEYAALNKRDLGDPNRTQSLFAFNLTPGNLRDTSGAAVYSASKMTDPVLFRLALSSAETEGAEVPISIERSGRKVFHLSNARVFRNPFGMELRFLAPKEILPPGQYQVALESGGRFSGVYFQFRVE